MLSGGDSQRAWGARLLLLLCAVALPAPVAAQTLTLTRGPYLQNPQALPTSATFVWWTNVAGDSTVEYGTSPALGSTMTVPQAGSCSAGTATPSPSPA